ncbi:MAG: glutamate-1-semialdehyde 2,1-aminomutase [Verrucomicrobiales bacterium]|jgi:glutamate-1-semialdehyde 2,1-aminomutase
MTSIDSAVPPHLRLTPPVDLDALIATAHAQYRAVRPNSEAADARARIVLPAGNTRSVLDYAPFPFRAERAEGSQLVDIDGHRYVDFCGNYTAGLLGHSPDAVKRAIVEALDNGWALGATHTKEIELAELICARFPSIEQVRFTNSGTEANLMAIGTALHHTSKNTVGVFEKAYHGGVLSFGSKGDPQSPLNVPHHFHLEPFNDMAALDEMFANLDLGCVLIEVVQGSGGCRVADVEYVQELRRRCDQHGVVLIFDEVMTSRLSSGGAQQRYDVMPDMTTLGKYLGGGMTFGAFGGRRKFLAGFDPVQGGTLTQAGTFNNNVISMAAAIETISTQLKPELIEAVNDRGDRLRAQLNATFDDAGLAMWVTGLGSMLTIHAADDRLLELLFHAAMADGYYLARRGFIALSMQVTDEDCGAFASTIGRWANGL